MASFRVDLKRPWTSEDIAAFRAFAGPILEGFERVTGEHSFIVHTTRRPTAQELTAAQTLLESLNAPSITEIP